MLLFTDEAIPKLVGKMLPSLNQSYQNRFLNQLLLCTQKRGFRVILPHSQ